MWVGGGPVSVGHHDQATLNLKAVVGLIVYGTNIHHDLQRVVKCISDEKLWFLRCLPISHTELALIISHTV